MEVRNARILLLEDDALISVDAEDMLLGLGAARVLVAHTVSDAEAILAREQVDAAVLDVVMGNGERETLTGTLLARVVPFIFASGYDASVLPENLRHVPSVAKPYSAEALSSAFGALGP